VLQPEQFPACNFPSDVPFEVADFGPTWGKYLTAGRILEVDMGYI
jgi:hypothetical protein